MKKQFEYTENGTYLISEVSGSRLKKVSQSTKLSDADFIDLCLSKLSFEKLHKTRLKQINKKEPLVFELIKKKEVKGTRIFYFKEKIGKDWINSIRFELMYEDVNVIKVNETLYLSCKNKLETKYSNF
jgi:hypothetical protein